MSMREDIETLAADFGKAFTNRDVDGVASYYAEDCKVLAPNAPRVNGQAAMKEVVQQYFDMGAEGLTLTTLDVIEAGDVAVECGRYELTIRPPDAESFIDVGKYVAVHQRQADGSLKMLVDTWNSDAPLPEP